MILRSTDKESAIHPFATALAEWRSTLKSSDVEEPIDSWLNRPLASVIVAVLAPLPITPNQVTLLSGFVGLLGGLAIGTAPVNHSLQIVLGAALVYCSILLDCADGQLARLRGQSSMVGRMLDGTVDVVPVAATFVGFFAFMCRAGYDPIYLNVLGWSAGYSMKWHVHSYDHAKNVYLKNVLPPGQHSNPLPTLEEIAAERDRHLREGDWLGAMILRGFMRFTRSQRGGWQDGRVGLGLRGTQTNAERSLYRERFRGTMRLWTWNGLATHLALLVVAALFTPRWHGAAAVAWWFILVPMNLFTIHLRARERRIERDVQGCLLPRPFSHGNRAQS